MMGEKHSFGRTTAFRIGQSSAKAGLGLVQPSRLQGDTCFGSRDVPQGKAVIQHRENALGDHEVLNRRALVAELPAHQGEKTPRPRYREAAADAVAYFD